MNKVVNNEPVTCSAQVQKLEELTDNVYRVSLQLEKTAVFQPGQYIEIQVVENHWQAFSLACLPGKKEVELHIQYLPERENSVALFKQLNSGNSLKVRLASGNCVLKGEDRPLTLVAAGTGFAQIKALVESLIEKNWQSPVNFYWAAKNPAGLYDLETAFAWQKKLADFTLIPIIEETVENWQGEVGMVTDVLASDYDEANSAASLEGFICGSPNMVYAVEDLLMEQGMQPKALLSDAHAYAPRQY
ncbi:hypothetical protein [Marinospirillum insulare]|uniref:FAD-binding FR-type domain-containing protein n=1 Tax=Marinospirillum insulare TaxID=217169 RepID=A0ABQ5ZXK2_9GAMM|nr:hypothetical protein [Marinospirillum insulare]GLR63376.1 hypothetical protein GCM10007878_08110 [Marinospirillum insulare]